MPTSPVLLSLPGLNENLDTNNTGFDSPSGEAKPTMEAYKVPPVLWMVIFIIGGYLGLRWILED